MAADLSNDQLYTRWGTKILQIALGTQRSRVTTRRIDSIECVDASTIRRRVECHLDLEATKAEPHVDNDIYLPLTRQPRPIGPGSKRNTGFTVVDEAGALVPRLTKVEERNMMLKGVMTAAEQVLGRPPIRTSRTLIGEIVTGTSISPDVLAQHVDQPDRGLISDDTFQAILQEVYLRYFLVVVLPFGESVRHRIISYWFDQQLERHSTHWFKRLWLPRNGETAHIETPLIAACHSYHLELLAPPDLAVPAAQASMTVVPEDGSGPISVRDDDPSPRRVHFYYEGARPSDRTDVRLGVMVAKTGLSFSIDAASIVAAILLGYVACLSWWGPDTSFTNVEGWVTILLAGPAIATAIMAIRSVHRMTSRLSRDKRITLALPTFTLFSAAIALLAPPRSDLVLDVLRGLALAVTLLTLWRVTLCWWTTRLLGSEPT